MGICSTRTAFSVHFGIHQISISHLSMCLDCACIIHFMHAICFMTVFIDILLSAQRMFDSMVVVVSNHNGSLFFWISLTL